MVGRSVGRSVVALSDDISILTRGAKAHLPSVFGVRGELWGTCHILTSEYSDDKLKLCCCMWFISGFLLD